MKALKSVLFIWLLIGYFAGFTISISCTSEASCPMTAQNCCKGQCSMNECRDCTTDSNCRSQNDQISVCCQGVCQSDCGIPKNKRYLNRNLGYYDSTYGSGTDGFYYQNNDYYDSSSDHGYTPQYTNYYNSYYNYYYSSYLSSYYSYLNYYNSLYKDYSGYSYYRSGYSSFRRGYYYQYFQSIEDSEKAYKLMLGLVIAIPVFTFLVSIIVLITCCCLFRRCCMHHWCLTEFFPQFCRQCRQKRAARLTPKKKMSLQSMVNQKFKHDFQSNQTIVTINQVSEVPVDDEKKDFQRNDKIIKVQKLSSSSVSVSEDQNDKSLFENDNNNSAMNMLENKRYPITTEFLEEEQSPPHKFVIDEDFFEDNDQQNNNDATL